MIQNKITAAKKDHSQKEEIFMSAGVNFRSKANLKTMITPYEIAGRIKTAKTLLSKANSKRPFKRCNIALVPPQAGQSRPVA